LATLVALHQEGSTHKKRFKSVRLPEGNPVPEHQVRFPVSFLVLAEYNPEVVRIFPRPHGPPQVFRIYSSAHTRVKPLKTQKAEANNLTQKSAGPERNSVIRVSLPTVTRG
jgi:hypothetical protein